MDAPRFELRGVFEAIRAERGFPADLGGLWAAGSLQGLARPTVALVGTRAATPYGRRLARAFARDLGAAGCSIISGLALGIDAAAHEGALEAGAATIGVLGGGHARFFPKRNAGLAERMISAGGLVLSPYAPEHLPQPHQFLERNGVVAALADAVVVIEAPARSGALNTAGWAAGRIPVLAVPGDVDRAHVEGCHALLRDGATLARSAADVLEELKLSSGITPRPEKREPDDPLARRLLAVLDAGETDLDELVRLVGGTAPPVLAALAMLELQGVVERRDAARFARML